MLLLLFFFLTLLTLPYSLHLRPNLDFNGTKWTKFNKTQLYLHMHDISIIKRLKTEQIQIFRSHSVISILKTSGQMSQIETRCICSYFLEDLLGTVSHHHGHHMCMRTRSHTQTQAHNIETTSLIGRISSNRIYQLIFFQQGYCCLHWKHSLEVTYGLTSRPDDCERELNRTEWITYSHTSHNNTS